MTQALHTTSVPMKASSDAWAVFGLGLAVLGIFHPILRAYWWGDDPAILLHALGARWFSAFWDPAVWRRLSPSNLTPWVTLSFQADLALAGLSTRFFHAHQLAAIFVLAGALYLLMRRWWAPASAMVAVLLFLVGAPTASVVEALATRHYLEGATFSVMALMAYLQAAQTGRVAWALGGAAVYALSVTAKEVYVPLVVLLPFLPVGLAWPLRMQLLAPYVAVAALYVVWRGWMLGALVGGYVDPAAALDVAALAHSLQVFGRFPEFLFGRWWPLPTALIVLAAGLRLALRRRTAPAAWVLAACVLLPLLPLLRFPGITGPDRYLFVLWLVVSLAGAACLLDIVGSWAARRGWPRSMAPAVCLVPLALAAWHSHGLRVSQAPLRQEIAAQGRFILADPAERALIVSDALLSSHWYATSLCEIRRRTATACPSLLVRGAPLTGHDRPLYRYDAAARAVIEVGAEHAAQELARLQQQDLVRPLQAQISLEKGVVRWQLGPHDRGRYFAVSQALGRYPLARSGELRVDAAELRLSIQFEADEGWSTASPELTAAPGRPVNWARSMTR